MDHWVAECRPCKYTELFDAQDDAIRAAEKHVYALHADVQPAKRAELGMGHVQNRTDNAIAVPVVEPEPQPDVVAASSPGGQLQLVTDSDSQEQKEE